jgi:hypothetical protein
VNGVTVRDSYGFDPTTGLRIAGQANMIPADDPLRSQIAAKVLAVMPPPDRPGLQYNAYGGISDASQKFDVKTWLLRVGRTFNPDLKMSTTFWVGAVRRGWLAVEARHQGAADRVRQVDEFPRSVVLQPHPLFVPWHLLAKGFQAVNRWQFVDDLTLITGRHTIKMGFEWRGHEFNLAGWPRSAGGWHEFSSLATGGYDAQGNTLWQTGDALASFLLG